MLQQPSVFLPPLKGIKACSDQDITDAITRLRTRYLPPVRGSTRRRRPGSEPWLSATKLIEDTIETIRADTFERSFSIQWLTRFISIYSEIEDANMLILDNAAALLAACSGAAASGDITRTFVFPFLNRCHDSLETMTPEAAAPEPVWGVVDDHDVLQVVLRDAPLESADFSSVGAQTWGGSCILAEMIAESPHNFGIYPRAGRTLRVLELGAGTGLASLTLAKVLEKVRGRESTSQTVISILSDSTSGERKRDIVVATDFHPSVLANLRINVDANFPAHLIDLVLNYPHVPPPTSLAFMPDVFVLPLDWSQIHPSHRPDAQLHGPLVSYVVHHTPFEPQSRENSHLQSHISNFAPPLDLPFDVIIGADIIYEHSHARWIRSCVEHFLKKPETTSSPAPKSALPNSSTEIALFHLIIPLRRTHASESRTVEEVFAPAEEVLAFRNTLHDRDIASDLLHPKLDYLQTYSPELAILSQEDIVCDAYADKEEAEEVVYRYYRIGWV